MKILLILSIMCLPNCKFYEKLLSDFSLHSSYVCLTINYKGENKVVIIENQNLFNYINKTERIDKTAYSKRMIKILKENKKLIIKSINTDIGFLEVEESEEVDLIAKKGKIYFLDYFFNQYKGLKDNILENKKRSIIKKLFEWEILCRIDDESGILVYED